MDNFFDVMIVQHQKNELKRVISCNNKTKKYNLVLSEEDAKSLISCHNDSLKDSERVEFGQSIITEIIEVFCDSQYINQYNYVEILEELQDIFYLYKNESLDDLTDSELIEFMRNQFDTICFGDLDYLSGTCLERFSRAIRSGYQNEAKNGIKDEYKLKYVENEYNKFSEETRWDDEVYKMKLEDMY